MKKNLLKLLIVAMIAFVLTAAFVACNNTVQGTNYNIYAGKYYEENNGILLADSWFELNKDGTWQDDEGETGTFKINNGNIDIYWLIDDEVAFSGYISNGELVLFIFGQNITYRIGTPSISPDNPSNPTIPNEPEDTEKFSITFDVNGGEDSFAPRSYEGGILLSDLPIPSRSGYIFINWMGSDNHIYDRTSAMPYYDLRLTAQWEKKVSSYEDDYVYFKPAIQGKKHDSLYYYEYEQFGISAYIYVELNSDDLGGRNRVGQTNNFDLSQKVNMEYYSKAGYTLNWYEGNYNNPNGAQLFTLEYGSNIQLLTVTNSKNQVVKRYLIDIYVLHDYRINLYRNIYEKNTNASAYNTYWVKENDTVPLNIQKYNRYDFNPTDFVYFNNITERFELFDFETVVLNDWDLYQTYDEETIVANLDDGVLEEELILKPYTQYQLLPTPTKEGYDFIGWKLADGSFFTDITGWTANNYLAGEDVFTSLDAEWKPKSFYEYWEDDAVTLIPTIPLVTYTDFTQTEICDIIYVPVNYDCTIPIKTPIDNFFSCWRKYKQELGSNESGPFDFNVKLTSPIALYASTTSFGDNRIGIPLNSSKTFTYNNASSIYQIMMPFIGEYVLIVKGNVTLTVNSYGSGLNSTNQQTYTSTSSEPLQIALSATQPAEYVTFSISSYSGKYEIGVYGLTGLSEGEPLVGGEFIAIGDTLTVHNKKGYTFDRWEYNNSVVSDESKTYIVNLSDSRKTFVSKWIVNDEMKNFIFELDNDILTITGLYDQSVKEILVPNYVDIIAKGAFSGCYNLEEISLPFVGSKNADGQASESSLFGYIFGSLNYDSSLMVEQQFSSSYSTRTTFYIPAKLRKVTICNGEIGYGAFYNCSMLTELYIARDVSSIGSNALYGCYKLVHIQNLSGNSVTSPAVLNGETISNSFSNFTNKLSLVNDNMQIYTVGDKAYLIWSSNTSIDLSNDAIITDIYPYAFRNQNISNIIFSDKIKTIGNYAFYNCAQLVNVELKNVESIGNYAFNYCSELKTIVLNEGITTIGTNILYGVNNLTSITLPKVENWQESLGYFYGSSSFSNNSYIVPKSIKNVTILGGTTISKRSFYGCSSIENLIIHKSITSIGEEAFTDCSSLQNVYIDDLKSWCEIKLSDKDSNPLYYATNCYESDNTINLKSERTLIIPDETNTINSYVFYGFDKLSSIIIPNSVTSIGYLSFGYCSSLLSVDFQGDSSLQSISGFAFESCSSLDSISFESCKSLQEIGYSAFKSCSSLKEINIPASVTSLGSGVFAGCISLQSLSLPFVGTSKAYQYSRNLFGDIFGTTKYDSTSAVYQESAGSIGPTQIKQTYYIPSSLKNVTIAGGYLPYGAFRNCSMIQHIVLGNDVKFYYGELFYNCTNLSDIDFPMSVTSLPSNMFSNTLWYDNQPDGVVYINTILYKYKGSIVPNNHIEILEGIKYINASAFAEFTELKSIILPKSLQYIGKYAFHNCRSLTIYYRSNETDWGKVSKDSDWARASSSNVSWALNIPIYYFSNIYPFNEEITEGNFWHYGASNSVEIWEKID